MGRCSHTGHDVLVLCLAQGKFDECHVGVSATRHDHAVVAMNMHIMQKYTFRLVI